LEAYRVPLGLSSDLQLAKGRRLGRFFRDEDEMAASADIAGLVRGAIEDSASLIVICSPNSARSHWVNAEIEHYRKTERSSRVFAVILSGQPNSGDPQTECFPPALRVAGNPDDPAAMPIEPLALDVRKQSKARLLARLAAGLMAIDFDTLWKRDRRRALLIGMRTVAIALVASASIALAIGWGVREQGRAASRDLAQASLAESAAGRYDGALRLAILANRQSVFQPASREAYAALARAATGVRTITEFRGHDGEVLSALSQHQDGMDWSKSGTLRRPARSPLSPGTSMMPIHQAEVPGSVRTKQRSTRSSSARIPHACLPQASRVWERSHNGSPLQRMQSWRGAGRAFGLRRPARNFSLPPFAPDGSGRSQP
jgi:hypothetical protein